MRRISVPEAVVDAAAAEEKRFIRVEGGYVFLSWVHYMRGEHYDLPLLEGSTDTVEIIEHISGSVTIQPGPRLSYDLPTYDPDNNTSGWFVDTRTGEFVRTLEQTDYGNGPGRAKAEVVQWVRPLRE